MGRDDPQPVRGKRVALIIGNGAYEAKIGSLDNPPNDAQDMAAALQRLGFTLIGGRAQLNLNKQQIIDLVEQFGDQLTDGVGVFYYAGHGVQINKRNYLIPLGAPLRYQEDVESEGYDVDKILSEMESSNNALNILILDACRNNILPRKPKSRNVLGEGLSKPQSLPSGVYMAFAARDGQTAAENAGQRNGLYTQELLKNLERPLRIEDIFINTRREVKRLSTRNGEPRQEPIEYGSLDDVFYLKVDETMALTPKPTPTPLPRPKPTPTPTPTPKAGGLPIDGSQTSKVSISFSSGFSSIRGQVTDQQGAVVPNVLVTATLEGASTGRETTTDGEGLYVLSLTPGVYSVTFTSSFGFRPFTVRNVLVKASSQTRISTIELIVGNSTG